MPQPMIGSPVWALVPAGGVGARMGSAMPKQYLPIAGKTILEHTLGRLSACPAVDKMMVAISPQDSHYTGIAYTHPKLHQVVEGGAQRADSVRNMLKVLVKIEPQAWALVHDAVRPFVNMDDIDLLVKTAAEKNHGGILGAPMMDTVKQANTANEVVKTVPRSQLWRAFTPQLFRAKELLEALQDDADASDEASAIENAGGSVFLLEGSPDNLKITRPADLALAESIYYTRKKLMRIGQGYDVHRLVKGRDLIIGGINIPHSMGLEGHSDADVLLHAICDALYGAAALGDIGHHFSPQDDSFKGMDSQAFLRSAAASVSEAGYAIANIDSTIIAEAPQMGRYILAIRQCIAGCAGINLDQVSVKATTTEGLGFAGEQQGIAAQAMVLLRERT